MWKGILGGIPTVKQDTRYPFHLNEDVDPWMAHPVTDEEVHIAEISDDLSPLRSTSNLMVISGTVML